MPFAAASTAYTNNNAVTITGPAGSVQNGCVMNSINATIFQKGTGANTRPRVYVQNMTCKGDGTDPATKVVRITETDVHSSFGTCKFVKKEHDGNTLAAQMSCDGPGGNILLGDVRFTVRDDKNVDFVDQDNTYKSVLYKCPQTGASQRAPAPGTH